MAPDGFVTTEIGTRPVIKARVEDGAFRIAPERVDLANCGAAFGNIQLFP